MSERFKSNYFYRDGEGNLIELTCHFKFEQATFDQKFNPEYGGGKLICNGCGPSGYGALVPDSILGVKVSICGHIHNWGYQFGKDREDRLVIDETFGDNMDRLIKSDYEAEYEQEVIRHKYAKPGNWLTKRYENWKHKRVMTYLKELYESRLTISEKVYEKAVRIFGKSSFWDKRKIKFTLEEVSAG